MHPELKAYLDEFEAKAQARHEALLSKAQARHEALLSKLITGASTPQPARPAVVASDGGHTVDATVVAVVPDAFCFTTQAQEISTVAPAATPVCLDMVPVTCSTECPSQVIAIASVDKVHDAATTVVIEPAVDPFHQEVEQLTPVPSISTSTTSTAEVVTTVATITDVDPKAGVLEPWPPPLRLWVRNMEHPFRPRPWPSLNYDSVAGYHEETYSGTHHQPHEVSGFSVGLVPLPFSDVDSQVSFRKLVSMEETFSHLQVVATWQYLVSPVHGHLESAYLWDTHSLFMEPWTTYQSSFSWVTLVGYHTSDDEGRGPVMTVMFTSTSRNAKVQSTTKLLQHSVQLLPHDTYVMKQFSSALTSLRKALRYMQSVQLKPPWPSFSSTCRVVPGHWRFSQHYVLEHAVVSSIPRPDKMLETIQITKMSVQWQFLSLHGLQGSGHVELKKILVMCTTNSAKGLTESEFLNEGILSECLKCHIIRRVDSKLLLPSGVLCEQPTSYFEFGSAQAYLNLNESRTAAFYLFEDYLSMWPELPTVQFIELHVMEHAAVGNFPRPDKMPETLQIMNILVQWGFLNQEKFQVSARFARECNSEKCAQVRSLESIKDTYTLTLGTLVSSMFSVGAERSDPLHDILHSSSGQGVENTTAKKTIERPAPYDASYGENRAEFMSAVRMQGCDQISDFLHEKFSCCYWGSDQEMFSHGRVGCCSEANDKEEMSYYICAKGQDICSCRERALSWGQTLQSLKRWPPEISQSLILDVIDLENMQICLRHIVLLFQYDPSVERLLSPWNHEEQAFGTKCRGIFMRILVQWQALRQVEIMGSKSMAVQFTVDTMEWLLAGIRRFILPPAKPPDNYDSLNAVDVCTILIYLIDGIKYNSRKLSDVPLYWCEQLQWENTWLLPVLVLATNEFTSHTKIITRPLHTTSVYLKLTQFGAALVHVNGWPSQQQHNSTNLWNLSCWNGRRFLWLIHAHLGGFCRLEWDIHITVSSSTYLQLQISLTLGTLVAMRDTDLMQWKNSLLLSHALFLEFETYFALEMVSDNDKLGSEFVQWEIASITRLASVKPWFPFCYAGLDSLYGCEKFQWTIAWSLSSHSPVTSLQTRSACVIFLVQRNCLSIYHGIWFRLMMGKLTSDILVVIAYKRVCVVTCLGSGGTPPYLQDVKFFHMDTSYFVLISSGTSEFRMRSAQGRAELHGGRIISHQALCSLDQCIHRQLLLAAATLRYIIILGSPLDNCIVVIHLSLQLPWDPGGRLLGAWAMDGVEFSVRCGQARFRGRSIKVFAAFTNVDHCLTDDSFFDLAQVHLDHGFYRKGYPCNSSSTKGRQAQWNSDGNSLASAWGQAEFQGGKGVSDLSHRYKYMGWFLG